MPQATFTVANFSLTSTWTVVRDPAPGMTTPTTASTTKDFTITGIPAGSTINSAVLTATLGSPLTGAAIRTVAIEEGSNYVFNGSFNATSAVAASFGAGDNTISAKFRFKANGTTDPPVGSRSSSLSFSDVTLTVNYTLPYSACTPPSSVSVSPSSTGPSQSATLSWSGAGAGTNNAITGYQLYRSTSPTSGYTALGSKINSTTTSGSATVTSHATNGTTYYYKVATIGTQSGYDSGQSSAYASLKTTWTAPTAPTTVSVSSAYVTGGNVTLSWSGATAGTNNPIKSYSIYRNGSAYTTSTSTSVSVPSNTGGNYYTYTVYTIGTHSNSGASSGATVYTYTNPTAPTNVKVAQTVINAGTSTTLSWTAGSNGHYNAITEYHVYRRTNGSGNYTYLNKTTGTSLSVTAHSTMASYYDYVVYSIGLRSNSGASGSARLTTKNYTKVNAPTTVSVSSTYVTGGNVTLSWSGASGGTNTTVASYQVYRNGTAYGNPTTGSSMVVPSASAGNSYTYTVVAISSPAGYNSTASQGATVYTYGAPSPPTTVTINGVAGTTYFGDQGRPTITLAWSGASAGTYGSISKYIVYRDGANPIETTSTSMVVTADGTYTVKTVASGGTSGASVGRAVTTIGAPSFNAFTAQPSGKSNGNVSYSWSANAAPANSSLTYHVAYRNGDTGSTWIAGTGTTTSYTLNVNNYITQGNYYQLGVLVRANATHGGYRDAAAGYAFSSANTAYRAAAPAKPTNLVFTDQGGNTSYSTNQVNLTFSYSIPTRGANVARYEIFYKYGKTGGYTKLVDNYNGSVTHNITSVAAGLQIYYKVEVVDEYGYRNSVESGDTYITKLVMPTISNASFTPTDVPNTAGKLVFTPGNGGVSRPLKYSARILYGGQSYSLTGFTQVPSPGSALTFTKTGMGINALKSAGMDSLFDYVITNANVSPVITVEITVADNQTIPVVGNQTVHTFTYTANYRTTPTLNGTLTLSNATATANSKTIDYVNSEDELAVSTSGMSVSWVNAAGTTVGQNLTYRLTYQGITENLSGFPSDDLVKTKLGMFTKDTDVTASLVIIQSFNGGVTTSSATKNASISAKRFIKPSITFANSERTAGTVFKTRIGISDSLCGGSSTANNIENIANLEITAGTTVNTVQNSTIVSNKWKINDTVVPTDLSSLNASAIADVNVSASATLTLSSGRTVTINSTPFLLKALGVALAIRKTRVGINVEPTSFVESENSPSFVIVENQLNTTTPYILDIQSAVGNTAGVGIRLFDTKRNSSTILTYKDNHFRIDGQPALNATNYNDYAPTKTGGGASGTWGISITGNAATASTATKLTTARTFTIGNTGKTFNGTGNVSWSLAEIGAAAASHGNHVPTTQTANNAVYLRNDNTWQTITAAKIGAAASSHNHTSLTGFTSISGGGATKNWQMSFSNDNYIFMREGTANSTIRFYPDSGNVWFTGSLTGGTVPWARVSGAPTSYPASDVSAWAKASTKPSYTAAEVGAAASGHGHSDMMSFNRVSIDTAGAGWFRLAYASSTGRGAIRYSFYTNGGSWTPAKVDVLAFHDWGSGAYFQEATSTSNTYITQFRFTTDGSKTYLEGYFRAQANGYSVLSFSGYDEYTLYSGSLPAGGGTEQASINVGYNARALTSNNWSSYVTLSSLGAAASSHNHNTLSLQGTSRHPDGRQIFNAATNATFFGTPHTQTYIQGLTDIKITIGDGTSAVHYNALHTGNYTSYAQKKITYGTAAPSGGSSGDIYIKY